MDLRKYYGRIGCLVLLIAAIPFWYLAARTGAQKYTRWQDRMKRVGYERVEAMIRDGRAEMRIVADSQFELTVHIKQSWVPAEVPEVDDLVAPEQLVGMVGDWAELKDFRYPLTNADSSLRERFEHFSPGYFQIRIMEGDMDFRRAIVSENAYQVTQEQIDKVVMPWTRGPFDYKICQEGDLGDRLAITCHCHEESPTSVGVLLHDCYHTAAQMLISCFPLNSEIRRVEEDYTIRLLLVVSPAT